MNSSPSNRELPLADAAHRLQRSWAQTWRLVLNGTLTARKIGGRWLVTESSVKRFEQNRGPVNVRRNKGQ